MNERESGLFYVGSFIFIVVCITLIRFILHLLISKDSCEGGGGELRIALVFLGPDFGFCLIFTRTLDKPLFLPVFDKAQDKALLRRNTIESSKAKFSIVDYLV